MPNIGAIQPAHATGLQIVRYAVDGDQHALGIGVTPQKSYEPLGRTVLGELDERRLRRVVIPEPVDQLSAVVGAGMAAA